MEAAIAFEAGVVLRWKEGGPRENGRAWVSPETLFALDLRPGGDALLSIGARSDGEPNRPSGFAPLEASDRDETDPIDPWGKRPAERQDVGIGGRFVGCRVWPNAKLRKGEIQISECLAGCLKRPDRGGDVNLHKVLREVSVCDAVRLRFVEATSDGNADRSERLSKLIAAPGSHAMRLLRTLINDQLDGRVLLVNNSIAVPLLSGALLFDVFRMLNSGEAVLAGRFDGARTELDVRFSETARNEDNDAFLETLIETAISDLEGSRKRAAAFGAREAARSGRASLARSDVDRIVVPDDLRKTLRSLVIDPIARPSVFASIGLAPPRGVVFHGPPGSGKTFLAAWAAKASEASFFVVDGPSLLSPRYGESEAALTGVFRAARHLAPSLIFLDELDAVLPSRENELRHRSAHDSGVRWLSTLLSEMDDLGSSPVVVLAATNRLESIDDALRRPGRFDREIEIGMPRSETRRAILAAGLERVAHSLSDLEISHFADRTHGFLPADIAALRKEASLVALRRIVRDREGIPSVGAKDFDDAIEVIRPSGLRELQIDVPKVGWRDIGGLEGAKQRLKESVEWPLRHAEALSRFGSEAPKGILLVGPPGCSKTLLAKAVATETGMNFVSIRGSEVLSAFVGESEKAIVRLFACARQMAPCVLFLDEADGLLSRRDEEDGDALGRRVLAQFLSEMDGIRDRGRVIVVGATNKPQLIDPALLRPGRMDRIVFVPRPDLEARKSIFEIRFRTMAIARDVDANRLASETEAYSGADLVSLCREAGVLALEEDMNAEDISMKHFVRALESSRPSLGRDDAETEIYESFRRGALDSSENGPE